MSNQLNSEEKLLRRIPSGISGLDTILGGGYFQGGIYLIAGNPGSGKTLLGNQISYNHAEGGGKAVYVTLLTESHARMISALQGMRFYRPEAVGDGVSYISGYQILETEKLDGLLVMLRQELRARKATLLVLDGLITAADFSQSELELKKFIHELQTLLEFIGCTAIILTGGGTSSSSYPQRTMVDGIMQLRTHRVDMRAVREIEVVKHRGSAHLLGANVYQINDDGIAVFPRAEGRPAFSIDPTQPPGGRLSTGVGGLDELMGGGIMGGSTTMLLGPAGSGKTILGLNYLVAGAKKNERGLYFGFYEHPMSLRVEAANVGLPLEGFEKNNLLQLIWHSTQEDVADALLQQLIGVVTRDKIDRVFIDGVSGLRDAAVYPNRVSGLLKTMSNTLRAHGVTTLISDESVNLFGPRIGVPPGGLSSVADNVILLRYVELQSTMRRVISVLKARGGGHNPRLHELIIAQDGVHIESKTFNDAEFVLSGNAHQTREEEPRR